MNQTVSEWLSVWTYFTSQYIWTRHDKYAVNLLKRSTYLANYLSSSSRVMVSCSIQTQLRTTSVFFNHTALAICKMHSTIQALQQTSLTGVLGSIEGIQGQTLMYIADTLLVTSHTLTYNWYVYLFRAIVNALDSYWRKTSESIDAFARILHEQFSTGTITKNTNQDLPLKHNLFYYNVTLSIETIPLSLWDLLNRITIFTQPLYWFAVCQASGLFT